MVLPMSTSLPFHPSVVFVSGCFVSSWLPHPALISNIVVREVPFLLPTQFFEKLLRVLMLLGISFQVGFVCGFEAGEFCFAPVRYKGVSIACAEVVF